MKKRTKKKLTKNTERQEATPMTETNRDDEALQEALQEMEELVKEPEAAEQQPETPQPDPELEAAKAQAEEYLTLAQRVQADFDNFRRRNEGVRAEAFEDGRRQVAAQMLPVLDNLERALAAEAEASPLKTGVELTLKQMRAIYEKLGVKEINRQGEPFDPELEDAVLQAGPEEGEPGTVAAVLQKGYQMGGTVLRHAMVKVVAE